MLTIEKMQQTSLSANEALVAEYILKNETAIKHKSIREIAQETFVHPSTFVRLAKKLGFSGWNELKAILLKEFDYLAANFGTVDANLPFNETDRYPVIAQKIAQLEQATISDTLSLLAPAQLEQAVNQLMTARKIVLYGNNANLLMAQDFILKMERIGKMVTPALTIGESMYKAYSCGPEDCSLLISYSGESVDILQVAEILKQQNSPIICLTSIGENSLQKFSDVILSLTTRERLYSKIGNYTVNTSIFYLLNVLYSCCFAQDYHTNLKRLIQIGEQIDTRKSSSGVMAESKSAHEHLLQ